MEIQSKEERTQVLANCHGVERDMTSEEINNPSSIRTWEQRIRFEDNKSYKFLKACYVQDTSEDAPLSRAAKTILDADGKEVVVLPNERHGWTDVFKCQVDGKVLNVPTFGLRRNHENKFIFRTLNEKSKETETFVECYNEKGEFIRPLSDFFGKIFDVYEVGNTLKEYSLRSPKYSKTNTHYSIPKLLFVEKGAKFDASTYVAECLNSN